MVQGLQLGNFKLNLSKYTSKLFTKYSLRHEIVLDELFFTFFKNIYYKVALKVIVQFFLSNFTWVPSERVCSVLQKPRFCEDMSEEYVDDHAKTEFNLFDLKQEISTGNMNTLIKNN